ncbi:MAG: recombinase RecB [Verrucomicrobia bacterium]|nr:MAG: recombinase RecB [Verrucomicrobiota bacterium]
MKGSEHYVKKDIKLLLQRYGAYFHMPVKKAIGTATVDFLCCVRGRFVAIETKAPGGRLTGRQKAILHTVRGAGGIAFFCSSAAEAEKILEAEIGPVGDLVDEIKRRRVGE